MIFYKNQVLIKTYDDLINDINNFYEVNLVIRDLNSYDIFLKIIVAILNKIDVILIDSDFTAREIESLGLLEENLLLVKKVTKKHVKDVSDLKRRLLNSQDWSLTLYTSGTTGIPKKVTHNFRNVTRNVKIADKFSSNVWGFAFNPTHIAGIQVFFQALLNLNPIIDIFDKPRDIVIEEIKENGITNISATSTYYRLMGPFNFKCVSVQMLTSGGEKFDLDTINKLKICFPNAKVRNIYASTEAGTIFTTQGDLFVVPRELRSKIKISNGELLLKSELIGKISSDLDEWYPTGDIVEIIESEPLKIKFLCRKNEMINVGGYKVNPLEVEEIVRLYDGVKDVLVYGKKNSVLGTILCADIVAQKDISEKDIKEYLNGKLQKFKVPRIINFVESLTTTKTGKIKR